MQNFMHPADSLVVTLITLSYLVFALQMFMQAKRGWWQNKGMRAVMLLVVVFVLCAFSGYATSLLPPSFWVAREFLHWSLAAAAWWLVLTNQAKFIQDMLRQDGPN